MRKLTFTGASGAKLDARLDLPSGEPVAWALVAHCFTCSKDLLSLTRLSHALSDHGWAVLRFDFTGIGSSEGEFGNPDFQSNVGDVIAAARHLRQHFAAPALLLGHSLGGAAVLAAAEQLPEVRAVAVLNTPVAPEQAPRLFGGTWEEARRKGFAELSIQGKPFRISASFFEHLARERMERTARELSRPLLVVHGTADELVPVSNGERLFDAARHPKSFVAVDGGDHLLSRRNDAVFVASVVASWASRYAPPMMPSLEPLPEVGHVEVAESGDGPYAQRITLGPHRLRADEPESFGGRDTGPSP
ncbi:MAG: alpha/beta fold hydrolase, partial [Myxococcaceae bacterium]